jgi:sugar O-acyltransferase (sialic acid O-acetyltransferase NeuD family)
MKKILLFGNSGHAKVVRSAAESTGLEIAGYFEKEKIESSDLLYLGDESEQQFVNLKNNFYFAAIGSNSIRRKVHAFADHHSLELCSVSDKSALIAKDVKIDRGSLIAPGAIVNAGSELKEGIIINSGAIIEHDCTIGAFTHVAPGAILLGGVTVGENCFIGAGSVIKEGVTLSSDVIIGAGSVVLESIHTAGTWVGSPAKKIR